MKKRFTYWSAIAFLSRYIKQYKLNFFAFYIGWFIDMLINLAMPVMLGLLVDEIVYYQNFNSFSRISIIILFMLIFMCVQYFVIYAHHQYLMNMYTYSIKKDLFCHWLNGTAENISRDSSGNILTLIQTYAEECLHFVIRNIVHFSNGILKLVLLAVLLFAINWRIGLFITIAAPFSVYINTVFGKINKKNGDVQRSRYSRYMGWLYEIIGSLGNVRILGAQEKVRASFCTHNRDVFAANVKVDVSNITAQSVISFINLLIRLVIYGFAGYLSITNNMTIGLLLTVISYYQILTEQIRWTSSSYLDSQRRVAYIKSIHDFLETSTEPQMKNELRVTKGEIKFDQVAFSYRDSSPLFSNLTFTVRGGMKIAIVGESGCGKSTLAYLLLAFYRPIQGKISIDEQDISCFSLKSIRSQIGLISQDILLFDGTIRENILLGNQHASEEEIEKACIQAKLWNFIQALPQGLDTIVGTRGQSLSGGQKQQLAIARIYIKNPPIIIFDEATSSLDDETERLVHEAWSDLLNSKTIIVIAHKISSVQLCDKVMVLKDGVIDQIGETQEIINTNKEFRRIFSISELDEEGHRTSSRDTLLDSVTAGA